MPSSAPRPEPDPRPLALTMGDPAGVGVEITLAAFRERAALELGPFAVYGDPDVFADRARGLGQALEIRTIARPSEAAAAFATALPVIPVPLARPAVPGKPDDANAGAVIAAIERATDDVQSGRAGAIVTNPIAKSVLYAAGFRHPGHTEFLAALSARHHGGAEPRPVMMLASEQLRVVPLTIHEPLAAVPRLVTRELIVETARIMADALARDFGIATPRISVAGLNPHAGERGTIGTEDRDVVAPAVAELRNLGLAISGPYSADTLFHAEARSAYDAVLAMYHDQALIPIKTLSFDRAVNVTLGLPFVRTSPDHGTAFDIAGQGNASAHSLIASLRLATELVSRRAGARPRTA